mmetsp:Transcript_29948/g.26509  ORF Transcript_29948/g.26509 Transcript_29948/m.26509 type:complete len:137 (+) Transcript_29948:1195-1605(+)
MESKVPYVDPGKLLEQFRQKDIDESKFKYSNKDISINSSSSSCKKTDKRKAKEHELLKIKHQGNKNKVITDLDNKYQNRKTMISKFKARKPSDLTINFSSNDPITFPCEDRHVVSFDQARKVKHQDQTLVIGGNSP